ncbi:MAG: type II toxin-antitoxin system Phd/YefM family antitoxin [Hyphomicrobiaceae bacterium]|nr:MAG: type II toxin-antitoxin system Phd/YefM family antitoxin [Hyphomicrobiaceae bacterium]
MKEIAISKFKATCLAVLEEVRRTGEPIRITRRGKPVAEVMPPAKPGVEGASWLGCMAGEIGIVGDIVGPLYSGAEVEEMDAEWLRNWDAIQAKGRDIAARNRREAARHARRKKRAAV